MVLYFNHCHASNMYPTSNRHPSHQSFGLASYGYPGQQSSQYGPPSNMGDMGCAMAQYQMSGLGNINDGIQQAGQGLSMPTSWHSPAVYTMSSCSRGSMFDEWATGHTQGQPPLSSSPCGHGPFSVSTASHHSAASSPSCNFGGYKLNGPTNLSGAVTPTPLGSSPGVIHHHGLHGSSGVSVNNGNSDPSVSNVNNGASGANNGHGTGSSGVNSASNNSDQEYSSQVQVQDLTHAGGHHSPDSGLTVSSDGVSSSDSPQHISGSAAHALHHHNHHHHHHHPTTAHHNNPGPTVTRPTPVRSPFEWMKPTKPSYQSQPNPEAVSIHPSERFFTSKTRTKDKYRVVYSDHQRLELEKEFHYSRYITIRRKAELAQMLGLSERQVKIWFQNRRAKERKQGKKREESKNKDGSVMMQPGQLHAPPGVLLPTKIINLE